MLKRMNYYWRIVATGSAFVGFGVGGILLALFVIPFVRAWPGSAFHKAGRVQRLTHRGYKIFLGYLQMLGVCSIQIEGAEKLQQGTHLIVANHPSLLDIVLLLSAIPEADCIVKAEKWKNPFFKGVLHAAGYIRNEHPVQLVETCVERLQAGRSLIIFPEGTRSLPRKLQKFKRGAATIALRSTSHLTPVTISCIPSTLTKAEQWYEVPDRPFTLSMKVGESIDVAHVTRDSRNNLLASRALTHHMEHYFLTTGPYDERA